MQQLYLDLTTTDPEKLLDLSQPAFKFVSRKRFDNLAKWDKDIITSLETSIEAHRPEIIKVISLMLPKLAEGWQRQRANVFGFGNFDPNSDQLLTKKTWTH